VQADIFILSSVLCIDLHAVIPILDFDQRSH